MKRQTVLSLEQALSLPSATLRFVHLGWRVIRIESASGQGPMPGDPNRYIGEVVVDDEEDDRRSYFIAPNVGKECIALNLKDPQGREVLKQLVRALDVDIFCCNTLPSRYATLGVDYETLKSVKPDIIWAAISAMGPDYPDTPGYDPALQASAGYMELTGEADGPPTLSGIPLIDLKAGDEVYAAVCLALAEKAESGQGKQIHVSMMQAAASWLITTLPLLDFDCDDTEVTRCGNEHRKFIPCNAYPTRDGYVYVAIGNDLQWRRLTDIPKFRSVANDVRRTNDGRHQEREAIHRDITAITRKFNRDELSADFAAAKIPHAPINTIAQVRDTDAVRRKLLRTRTPDGHVVHLPPMATDIAGAASEYPFAAKFGADTEDVLAEAGVSDLERARLRSDGVIA